VILTGDWAPEAYSVNVNIRGDLVLGNLEGPILPHNHTYIAEPKAGPSLFSSELPSNSAEYVFSLANNHIMDFGEVGLENTIRAFRQRGIRYCGAGNTITSARKSLTIQNGETSVGIIACCEAQFGVARISQMGVAEFGPWIYQEVSNLSKQVDAVIVSVHAAVETSPWPSPYIRDLYRSFIDAGATVVHGHHAHVPQGYEQYHNGVIFYGLGNFAVDPIKWQNSPNGLWSLGAEIDLSSKSLQWEPITFEIRHQVGSKKIRVDESSDEEQTHHMQYLEMCNRPLHNDDLLEALWQEVAIRAYYTYGGRYMNLINSSKLRNLKCVVEYLSKFKRRGFKWKGNSNLDKPKLLLYYHMIVCESHRQMLATALGVLSGEIRDLRTDETRLLADEMTRGSGQNTRSSV